MRKFLSVIAVIVTSMILSLSVFAGQWKFDGNDWKYLDNNGDEVSCAWQKSGESWYYLDANGKMAVSALVDNDDCSLSYVDETGAKVVNKWVLITDVDHDIDNKWLYFKANGRSVVNGWYTINNQKYHFTNNKMNVGFIDDNGEVEDYVSALYYCGDNGARVEGWVETEDSEGNKVWVYFKNGKKVCDTITTINGQKYMFDADGKMLTGVQTASDSNASMNFQSNGALAKKAWTQKTDDNGDSYWIYSKNNGELAKDEVIKINGKWYRFEAEKMLTGFVFDDGSKSAACDLRSSYFLGNSGVSAYAYYCESSDSTEGSAFVSKREIELADGTFTFLFNSDGKINMNTIVKGYVYVNGVLAKHSKDNDDFTYGVVAIPGTGKYCLVNTTGKLVTKDVNDSDATKWIFANGKVGHYRKNDKTKAYDILIGQEYEVYSE